MWIHSACGAPVVFEQWKHPRGHYVERYRCSTACPKGGANWQIGHPSDDPRNWREIPPYN